MFVTCGGDVSWEEWFSVQFSVRCIREGNVGVLPSGGIEDRLEPELQRGESKTEA